MFEVFYGKRIHWNWEISRLLACDKDYVFPKGFCSVYYVDPRCVLERGFDKVILLQREKAEIRADIYGRLNITRDLKRLDERIEFYYELMYEHDISHPNLFRLHLQELSNYSVAVLSDLFDFVGIPKKHRPIIYPFPIWHHPKGKPYEYGLPILHRDWKKHSSILRKGHLEGKPEKDEYTQMVNTTIRLNPYKLAPEEFLHQNGRTFRLIRDDRKGGLEFTVDTLKKLDYIKKRIKNDK